tara:strand:- start:574 stop:771 length:198 start_codon:yes stop_codon:yes gene_type:complete
MKDNNSKNTADKINRAEAIKKFGNYAAFAVIGSFIILSPKKAQAQSPAQPGSGFPSGFKRNRNKK